MVEWNPNVKGAQAWAIQGWVPLWWDEEGTCIG